MPFQELNKPSDTAQHSLKHESRLIDTTLIIIMRASRMLRSSDSKREKTPGEACRRQNVTYLHKNIKRTSRTILAQNIWTRAISMARVRICLFSQTLNDVKYLWKTSKAKLRQVCRCFVKEFTQAASSHTGRIFTTHLLFDARVWIDVCVFSVSVSIVATLQSQHDGFKVTVDILTFTLVSPNVWVPKVWMGLCQLLPQFLFSLICPFCTSPHPQMDLCSSGQ